MAVCLSEEFCSNSTMSFHRDGVGIWPPSISGCCRLGDVPGWRTVEVPLEVSNLSPCPISATELSNMESSGAGLDSAKECKPSEIDWHQEVSVKVDFESHQRTNQ
jgi:hypothetical protein